MAKRSDIVKAFLEDCEILSRIKDKQTFTQSAKQLGISRQRVEARMQRLVDYFGRPLFIKEGYLTDFARQLSIIGLVMQRLRTDQISLEVRIAAPPSWYELVLQLAILEFESTMRPLISVNRIDSSPATLLSDNLSDWTIDLAFLHNDGSLPVPIEEIPPTLVSRPLWSVDHFAVIPEGYTDLARIPERKLKVSDLVSVPLIWSPRPTFVGQAFREAGFPLTKLKTVIKTLHYPLALKAAAQGRGVAFVPAHFIFSSKQPFSQASSRVAVRNISHLVPPRIYYLLRQKDRPLTSAQEHFLDFIIRWDPKMPGIRLLKD